MSYIRGAYAGNPHGVIYIKGNEITNNSQRLVVNEKTDSIVVERRIQGEWIMASMIHVQSFDKIITTKDGVLTDELGNIITKT